MGRLKNNFIFWGDVKTNSINKKEMEKKWYTYINAIWTLPPNFSSLKVCWHNIRVMYRVSPAPRQIPLPLQSFPPLSSNNPPPPSFPPFCSEVSPGLGICAIAFILTTLFLSRISLLRLQQYSTFWRTCPLSGGARPPPAKKKSTF